jgi:hypothetical protein
MIGGRGRTTFRRHHRYDDGSETPLAFSSIKRNASLTRHSQITEIRMAMIIHYPLSTRRSPPHTKPLKPSHCSSTGLHQPVHRLEMEMDAVLVLAPLRFPHFSAIPCRPVQPSSQPHNPWLILRPLACLHLLTGDRLRLPALILGTIRMWH